MPNQPDTTGFHPDRVDLLIQFCLAVAGEGDPGEQALGPIHLVKYVYLADLIYAASNEGQTFTGSSWRFHHFGPWSTEVWKRIEPAALAAGIPQITIPSTKYERDAVVYQAGQELSADELDKELPMLIALQIRNLVRKYRSFTPELLHFVYGTNPMLNAAPGETLDFSLAVLPPKPKAEPQPELSKAQIKSLRKLKAQLTAKKGQEKTKRRVSPTTQPRYDEAFDEIGKLIEEQECALKACKGKLSFSSAVWKSRARGDMELN